MNSECEFLKLIDTGLLNNCRIECIVPCAKGFIVAGENLTIYFYDAIFDDETYYTRSKTITVILLN